MNHELFKHLNDAVGWLKSNEAKKFLNDLSETLDKKVSLSDIEKLKVKANTALTEASLEAEQIKELAKREAETYKREIEIEVSKREHAASKETEKAVEMQESAKKKEDDANELSDEYRTAINELAALRPKYEKLVKAHGEAVEKLNKYMAI